MTTLGFSTLLVVFKRSVMTKDNLLGDRCTLLIFSKWRVCPRSEEEIAIKAKVFRVNFLREMEEGGCQDLRKLRT